MSNSLPYRHDFSDPDEMSPNPPAFTLDHLEKLMLEPDFPDSNLPENVKFMHQGEASVSSPSNIMTFQNTNVPLFDYSSYSTNDPNMIGHLSSPNPLPPLQNLTYTDKNHPIFPSKLPTYHDQSTSDSCILPSPLPNPRHYHMSPLLPTNMETSQLENSQLQYFALRESIRNFLANPTPNRITIITSKVAQKSYGNEKRFFCPPPCIYLTGAYWAPDSQGKYPTVFVGMEETGTDACQILFEENGFGCAKHLFISDYDKRKNFSLYFQLLSHSGSSLGVFKSSPMKVISKPSKKKLSDKNTDLSVQSSTTVCLFNRVKTSTSSTRFLAFDQGRFVVSSSKWAPVFIQAVDGAEGRDRNDQDTCILYGQDVVLKCPKTGTKSPVLVVRRVEKNIVYAEADGPVSQLHKIALWIKGLENTYFAEVQGKITQFKATPDQDSPSRDLIDDTVAWTIISSDITEYSFFEASGPAQKPIGPAPLVESIKIQNRKLIEIHGVSFTRDLKVWFDDVCAKTIYRCENFLLCVPPSVTQISEGGLNYCRKRTEVKLSLVRDDGIIYPTNFSYIYEAEPVPLTMFTQY